MNIVKVEESSLNELLGMAVAVNDVVEDNGNIVVVVVADRVYKHWGYC